MLLINSLRNSILNPDLSAIWIYNKVFVNQAKTAKLIPAGFAVYDFKTLHLENDLSLNVQSEHFSIQN